jgi:hypothetical protein
LATSVRGNKEKTPFSPGEDREGEKRFGFDWKKPSSAKGAEDGAPEFARVKR